MQPSSSSMQFAIGAGTDPGITRRDRPNEDNLLVVQGSRHNGPQGPVQQWGLFIVADGMGGHVRGGDASRMAIQCVAERVLPRLYAPTELNEGELTEVLTTAVQAANESIWQVNQGQPRDMGTTITAALVVGLVACVVNVGDSRTYVFTSTDSLRQITNDHSLVSRLVADGQIEPDDVYTHPQRNQIFRSLGSVQNVEVDWFMESLPAGACLLLCSDGLWEMVRNVGITEILSTCLPDAARAGAELIDAALLAGGADNVSAVVVLVSQAVPDGPPLGVSVLAQPEGMAIPLPTL